MKAVYEEGRLERKDYFCILVSGMLLAPAKVIYSVILLLCFLIPSERFANRKQKRLGIALILAAAVVAIVVFQLNSLTGMAGGTDGLNWEGQHNYTLGFAFQHPFQTLIIFLNTIQAFGEGWLYQMIGGSLSGLTLPVPTWIINIFILIFFLSALSRADMEDHLLPIHRGYFLSIFSAVLLLGMASMFLGWTSDFRQIILGVQGRYLIPVFPLVVFVVNNKTVVLRKNVDKGLSVMSVLLHGSVIMTILDYTMQN